MAHKFIYPDAVHCEKNSQCGGSDCSHRLAAEGFWSVRLTAKYPCLGWLSRVGPVSSKRPFIEVVRKIGVI